MVINCYDKKRVVSISSSIIIIIMMGRSKQQVTRNVTNNA